MEKKSTTSKKSEFVTHPRTETLRFDAKQEKTQGARKKKLTKERNRKNQKKVGHNQSINPRKRNSGQPWRKKTAPDLY